MLNENDPARDAAWLASETAAAMGDLARTVTDAPPLRLTADDTRLSPARARRRARAAQHWWTWLAPVAAAAAVAAIAVSLVLIRDIPTGGAASPNPATSTGPDGVPRYYVALQEFPQKKTGLEQNNIVVGDSLTGQTIATFAPPEGTTFWSVSAAADDRTFVVEALSAARAGETLLWPNVGAGTITASWFEVHLAPGTADPARLTRLPVKPQSWTSPNAGHGMYDPATSGVVSTAVSQSGREVAVLDVPAGGREEVKIFSLATGRVLHDWTTDNPAVRVPIQWTVNGWPLQALTWIDGDRAIAFAAITSVQVAPSTGNPSGEGTLRSLDVTGPASGDLLADSTVIWSGRLSWTTSLSSCFSIESWPLQISAVGKTVSCAQSDGSRIAFATDSLTAGATAAGTIEYQVAGAQGTDLGIVWTSASGGTLVGVWGTNFSLGRSVPLHLGVISHGTFTPLRLPSSLASTFDTVPYQIAF